MFLIDVSRRFPNRIRRTLLRVGVTCLVVACAFGTAAPIAASDPAMLVRVGEVPLDATWEGLSEATPSRFQFRAGASLVEVEPSRIVRFGSRSTPQGGTLVVLTDQSILPCNRAELIERRVRLVGGLFGKSEIPVEHVAYVIRRFPYDIVAGDRLRRDLQQLAGREDLVVTDRGDVQRGIIRELSKESSMRIGIDDLVWFDNEGSARVTTGPLIRAIVFGSTEGKREGESHDSDFAVGWQDGTYLASARLDDAARICSTLVDELTLEVASAAAPLCYLGAKEKALDQQGVRWWSALDAVRYRSESLLWGGMSATEWFVTSPDSPGRDATPMGLPVRIAGRQYPHAIVPHPVSTSIYIVPAGSVLKGMLAVVDLPYAMAERPSSADSQDGFTMRIAAGSSTATIEPRYESGLVRRGDRPVPFTLSLGGARIVVIECDATSPTILPGLIDARIETANRTE